MQNRSRVLRLKDTMAIKTHDCDACDEPIFPGDYYAMEVSVIRCGTYKYLRVRKEHLNPPCPFSLKDWDEETPAHTFVPLRLVA